MESFGRAVDGRGQQWTQATTSSAPPIPLGSWSANELFHEGIFRLAIRDFNGT